MQCVPAEFSTSVLQKHIRICSVSLAQCSTSVLSCQDTSSSLNGCRVWCTLFIPLWQCKRNCLHLFYIANVRACSYVLHTDIVMCRLLLSNHCTLPWFYLTFILFIQVNCYTTSKKFEVVRIVAKVAVTDVRCIVYSGQVRRNRCSTHYILLEKKTITKNKDSIEWFYSLFRSTITTQAITWMLCASSRRSGLFCCGLTICWNRSVC